MASGRPGGFTAGLHRPIYWDKETVKSANIYKGVRDLLQRYVDKAGLTDIHLHDFRAKAITDAKKQGHDPQALAGHTTETQTVRYLRNKEIPLVCGPSF